ncbi:MAG TPA: hypothetical protein VND94_00740 [Terriglobia bacterium]|nr:hypothetical protein [Terriglobia bacterium]
MAYVAVFADHRITEVKGRAAHGKVPAAVKLMDDKGDFICTLTVQEAEFLLAQLPAAIAAAKAVEQAA